MNLGRGGIVVALTILLLSRPTAAFAQGPPINSETALLAGFTTAFRAFLQEVNHSGDLPGGLQGDLHIRAVPLILPYAITQGRLVVGAAVPYLEKEMEIRGTAGTERLSESGFGDLRLFAEYALYIKDDREKTMRAIAIGGIDLPTGSHGSPDLPPGLWNGSGAANYLLGTAFSYIPPRWGLYTDLIYRITTEGSGVEFGDTLRYDLAVGYRVWPAVYKMFPSPQVNLYLELNGLWEQRSRDFAPGSDGRVVADSGGNRIFLSPGIQYVPTGRAFLVETSVQLPVVENLNGNQLETDYQFNVGIRWLIL